jgi:hypothetical protein
MCTFMKVFCNTNLFMWFSHFQTQPLKSYSCFIFLTFDSNLVQNDFIYRIGGSNYQILLLENRAFVPVLIFHLYGLFLAWLQMMVFVPVGATNRYKCPLSEARRRLIQPTRYNASH